MSSKNGERNPLNRKNSYQSKSAYSNNSADQLRRSFTDLAMESARGDGRNSNLGNYNNNAARQYAPRNSSVPNAWGNSNATFTDNLQSSPEPDIDGDNAWPSLPSDPKKPAVIGTNQGNKGVGVAPNSVVYPRPQHGCSWSSRVASPQLSQDDAGASAHQKGQNSNFYSDDHVDTCKNVQDEDEEEDDTEYFESDDELDGDSDGDDTSEMSHEDRKQNKWFKKFFETMDKLTLDQINDRARRWHCPACRGGPGAIDWYNGLQPVVAHCRQIAAKRVKLHRELAVVLEEELNRRGTSVLPRGDVYGKWQGLNQNEDKEIVWPPMVLILNTRLEKPDNDKWTGMGNQELLEYFSSYAALKARHSYGPQGHRGISVLIFEDTAVGYLEAERLSKHFEESGRNRDAWENKRVLFYPGGKRQLYGYMATKKDMEIFNQHSAGKSRLKYDLRSYNEMVVSQLRQMKEDNQQLTWYKNRVAKEQRYSKAMEDSQFILSEKLDQALQDNAALRLRTKIHHEQNKEAIEYLDNFYSESLDHIYEERNKKEDEFEKLLQKRLEKVKNYEGAESVEDQREREENIAKFVELQDEDMKAYIAEREELLEMQKHEMDAMKRRHKEEEIDREEEFNAKLDELMKKYSSQGSQLPVQADEEV